MRSMRWIYVAGAVGIAATLAADIWTDIDYRIAANVSLVYIAVLASVFAALYGWRSRWWSNRIGKIFLVQSVLLAIVVVQGSVSVWWPDGHYPGKDYLRFAIYSLGAVAYVPMLISLWREQQADRREANHRMRHR